MLKKLIKILQLFAKIELNLEIFCYTSVESLKEFLT